METPESIKYVEIMGKWYSFEATSIGGKTINQTLTNSEDEIPSSAAVWQVIGDMEELLKPKNVLDESLLDSFVLE